MNEKASPKILIAEDVESNFLYLKAVLSKLNATIYWAKNGIEAVEICEKILSTWYLWTYRCLK